MFKNKRIYCRFLKVIHYSNTSVTSEKYIYIYIYILLYFLEHEVRIWLVNYTFKLNVSRQLKAP